MKNFKGLVCHIHGDLLFVKMIYAYHKEHFNICIKKFINFYLLKLQIVHQPIENILLKHITRVVFCFSKNTSVDQNLLHKNLLSYKKLSYFAEQANISYKLAIFSL